MIGEAVFFAWLFGFVVGWPVLLPLVTRKGMEDFETPLDGQARGLVVWMTTAGALLWPALIIGYALTGIVGLVERRIENEHQR